MNDGLTLYTFSISHFSEKVRWCLDRAGLAFREVPLIPVLHVPRTVLMSRRATTVPILKAGHSVIQDSTRILEWLERHRAPFAPIPTDPTERAEAMEIEARFDRIGQHLIRMCYAGMLADPRFVVEVWTADASSWERALMRATLPVLRPGLERILGATPANVEKSRAVVAEGADWIAARIADGRRYLSGDRLGVADITAAALLAPLACPDEHPVYRSEPYRTRASALQVGAPAAYEWVRELYRTERRA